MNINLKHTFLVATKKLEVISKELTIILLECCLNVYRINNSVYTIIVAIKNKKEINLSLL